MRANKGTTEVQFRTGVTFTDAKGNSLAGKRGVITARFGSPKEPHSKAAAVVSAGQSQGWPIRLRCGLARDMDLCRDEGGILLYLVLMVLLRIATYDLKAAVATPSTPIL